MFTKAAKSQIKAKILIEGFSSSGKTMGALFLATGLSNGKKIAFLDTENKRSLYYADRFNFEVNCLAPPCSPESYIEHIEYAEKNGFSVLIIDSITHEWEYCLDLQSQLGGDFRHWKNVTPRHNRFIEAIRHANIHIISTVRSKVAYIMAEKANSNKLGVQKVGTKAITRDGFEYENTIVFTLNEKNIMTVTKGVEGLTPQIEQCGDKLSKQHGEKILTWCMDGIKETEQSKQEFTLDYVLQNGDYKGKRINEINDLEWLSKWGSSEKTPMELRKVLKEQYDKRKAQ